MIWVPWSSFTFKDNDDAMVKWSTAAHDSSGYVAPNAGDRGRFDGYERQLETTQSWTLLQTMKPETRLGRRWMIEGGED